MMAPETIALCNSLLDDMSWSTPIIDQITALIGFQEE